MKDDRSIEARYSRSLIMQVTGISVDFLESCEAENLVQARQSPTGEPDYSAQDIRRLALIYRLHEVLGIELQDIEVVLSLRKQLMDFRRQMDEIERLRVEREDQLLHELGELRRRLAADSNWR